MGLSMSHGPAPVWLVHCRMALSDNNRRELQSELNTLRDMLNGVCRAMDLQVCVRDDARTHDCALARLLHATLALMIAAAGASQATEVDCMCVYVCVCVYTGC